MEGLTASWSRRLKIRSGFSKLGEIGNVYICNISYMYIYVCVYLTKKHNAYFLFVQKEQLLLIYGVYVLHKICIL